MIQMTRTARAAGVLAGGLLVVALTSCSDSSGDGAATSSASAPVAESTAVEPPPGATTSSTATESDGNTDTDANCSGTSCSVTISGDAQTEVLGTRISLGEVRDGRATLGVGDKQVSCAQGETVSAGPLKLQCTTVTADSVTLTASLG